MLGRSGQNGLNTLHQCALWYSGKLSAAQGAIIERMTKQLQELGDVLGQNSPGDANAASQISGSYPDHD